ncbi:MAG: DMT family transporter [Gorillibacterium sp.]|nr:DMT family transporter [Gorillibacterium sp.]
MVAAIWGLNFGFSRMAMDVFDPVLLAFLRFFLAVPFFFLLLKLKEKSVGLPIGVLLKLMVIGFFGITMLEIMVLYSIQYTTLANASLLNVAPWPIFTALFAPFITKEKVTARLLTGGAIAMIGVYLIISGGAGFEWSSRHMTGNLIALGASLIGALYNLVCMPLMKTYSSLRISTWYIFFGSLFMFPLTLSSWGKVAWASLGTTDYLVLGYNIILSTVVAFVVWNACMYRVGTTRSNFFRYTVSAFAVLMGYMFFKESVNIWQVVGAAFMAGGLVWITLERSPSTVVSNT